MASMQESRSSGGRSRGDDGRGSRSGGRERDEDGRFTTIARKQNIPMLAFEKNLDLEGVLKSLFAK